MARPMSVIAPGDLVALVDPDGGRVLVRAGDAPGAVQKIANLGVVDLGKLAGLPWGSVFSFANKRFHLIPPTTPDLLKGFARKAQVILPKDASRIVFECGLRSGMRVVEAGIGSAFLTATLAQAVAPSGRVHTFELREDFAAWGRNNLRTAGLEGLVDLTVHDITTGIPLTGVDAVILDMPTPAEVVPHARRALRQGGTFCSYSPMVSQVESTHRALQEGGFIEVRTLELLEREWEVTERGSRPATQMLGHTAFLTFARRVGD